METGAQRSDWAMTAEDGILGGVLSEVSDCQISKSSCHHTCLPDSECNVSLWLLPLFSSWLSNNLWHWEMLAAVHSQAHALVDQQQLPTNLLLLSLVPPLFFLSWKAVEDPSCTLLPLEMPHTPAVHASMLYAQRIFLKLLKGKYVIMSYHYMTSIDCSDVIDWISINSCEWAWLSSWQSYSIPCCMMKKWSNWATCAWGAFRGPEQVGGHRSQKSKVGDEECIISNMASLLVFSHFDPR